MAEEEMILAAGNRSSITFRDENGISFISGEIIRDYNHKLKISCFGFNTIIYKKDIISCYVYNEKNKKWINKK